MNNNRRHFFGLAALASFFGIRAAAQPAPHAGAKELSRQTLSGPQQGMEAILVEVTALPGSPSAAHRHPGFVMGYVLEGEMTFAINGKTPETLKAGQPFFEPIGALHTTSGSAKPDAPVRFLAFIVAPKGSRVALPA